MPFSHQKKGLREELTRFDFDFQDTRDGHWMMNLDIMWKKIDMKLLHII